MPTNTYSDRVNIIKYVKLDEGWRFAPLARKPNGNIRWDTVLIEGVEMRHPEGRYFIEWRHEGRRRRKAVGTIPSEILAAAQRQRAILNLRSTGVEVKEPEPSARMTYLQDASAKYLRDVEMNKARSTYVHYRQTLNLFKASLEKATTLPSELRASSGLSPACQMGSVLVAGEGPFASVAGAASSTTIWLLPSSMTYECSPLAAPLTKPSPPPENATS